MKGQNQIVKTSGRHKIAIIAGEPSGDQLGVWLIEALQQLAAREGLELEIQGIGGPLMQTQGFESWLPMEDLAVNGLTEVLRHIPKLKRHIKSTVQRLDEFNPDTLVTIDAPGFCFRVAKGFRVTQSKKPFASRRCKLVHYVAPTVWAWRPGRAKKIAAFLDGLFVLLPFEPPYFEKEGLKTWFVGHPVVRQARLSQALADRPKSEREDRVDQDTRPILLLLPGSRKTEVRSLLPQFEAAISALPPNMAQAYRVIIPAVEHLAQDINTFAKDKGWQVEIKTFLAEEKWRLFHRADLALAASGTASLELAACGTPTIVAYKPSWLTTKLVSCLVKVRFASLVNILADQEIQPEFLGEACTPDAISAALLNFMEDPDKQETHRQALRVQIGKLLNDDEDPSMIAARALLNHDA